MRFSPNKIMVWALYLVALTPLVYFFREFPFGYPLSKLIFFRGLIGAFAITLASYVIYCVVHKKNITSVFPGIARLKIYLKDKLFVAFLFVFFSIVLSTIFALHPYRAFFGDIDRQSGLLAFIYYFLFLALTLIFFKEKEWLTFFKISLCVSAVLIFYGFLQYFKIPHFPFALPTFDRPGSFLGGPSFFGTHLIFTLLFAGIVFIKSSMPWRWLAGAMVPLSMIMIFMTATRGAMLGLAASAVCVLAYAAFRGNGKAFGVGVKKIALVSMSLMLILIIFFFTTKDNPLWQKVPGLERISESGFININDPSVRQRILAWELAFNLFKEKPIVGWGVDNFLFGYLMRYNPEMSLYGETWLDRSHNFMMDILAMQGAVGALAYLLFFAMFFRSVWRRMREPERLKIIFVGVLLGYIVQNLFLFDQIVSYVALMSVLGFVISRSHEEGVVSCMRDDVVGLDDTKRNSGAALRVLTPLAAAVFVVGVLYSSFLHMMVPIRQARAAYEVKQGGKMSDVMRNWNRATVPYNFAQFTIRNNVTDFFYEEQRNTIGNLDVKEFTEALIEGQEELIRKEPYDIRPYIRVARLSDILAENDPSWYVKSEVVMRKALDISPARPELYFRLAVSLGEQKKNDEVIQYLERAVSLAPNYWRPYYHLGVAYEIVGRRDDARRTLSLAKELNPDFESVDKEELNNIINVYFLWGENEMAVELIMAHIGFGARSPVEFQHKQRALVLLILKRDKENLITLALSMAQASPELKDDLDILVDLANRDAWDVIENTFLGY